MKDFHRLDIRDIFFLAVSVLSFYFFSCADVMTLNRVNQKTKYRVQKTNCCLTEFQGGKGE